MNTTKTTVHSDDGSNYFYEEDRNFMGSTFQIPSMDHVEQSSLSDDGSSDSEADSEDNNPFRIPTDEEVFLMKDEEKKQKQLERMKLAKLPIHEKTTFTTRFAVKRYRDTSEANFAEKYNSARLPLIHNTNNTGHTTTGMYKENIADLLAKKRKMFLIQMSIDTKKFEIAKLEEKAAEKEKKIEQEERTLMRDVQRFDDFLTENDIRAVEAINMANEENRLKEGKKKDVQKLNARIAAVNNEIAKLDDQLENCKRYKSFLDKLTPKEWIQQQQQQKEKQREHEESKQQQDSKNEVAPKRVTIGKTTTSNIQTGRPRGVSDARSTRSDSSTRRSREHKLQQLPEPRTEDIWKKEREEIEHLLKNMPEMYFKEPDDLLNIFAELEEENLFLIQNTQVIEEQLEDLKRVYRETKEKRYVSNNDRSTTSINLLMDFFSVNIQRARS